MMIVMMIDIYDIVLVMIWIILAFNNHDNADKHLYGGTESFVI